MSKIIRKYSKNCFSAKIIFEYLAFCENHLSNKIEDRFKNYLDRIKDNFILSFGHVWTIAILNVKHFTIFPNNRVYKTFDKV